MLGLLCAKQRFRSSQRKATCPALGAFRFGYVSSLEDGRATEHVRVTPYPVSPHSSLPGSCLAAPSVYNNDHCSLSVLVLI